jgi:hypothetical protein
MSSVFTGPPDPRDVIVTVREVIGEHGDATVVRVAIEDATDTEGVEMDCPINGTTYSSHRCARNDLEDALVRYLNLLPPRLRLEVVRARAEMGGVYAFGGDGERGLYVTEPPIRVAA